MYLDTPFPNNDSIEHTFEWREKRSKSKIRILIGILDSIMICISVIDVS